MSHDQLSYDHHRHRGNHQNLHTTNGIAVASTTNHVVGKLHAAQSMDRATDYESRSAQIEIGENDDSIGPVAVAFPDSPPRRQHHRNHSDTNDNVVGVFPGQQRQTTNLIGPSASIPDHMGSARQPRNEFYLEEPDGASASKSYDVTTVQSDRRKKETPRQPSNVELLTYRPTLIHDTGGEEEEERYEERFVGETDMSLSQQETVSEIDAKIHEMVRKRKVSQGTGRTPKTNVLPTKESMKEVMNLAPERKKKTSRTEARRSERNSVHGVPWETPGRVAVATPELEQAESARRERDANLKRKLDRRKQKTAKADVRIQLVGYRRVGEFSTSPPIPEEGEASHVGIRQSSSLNFASSSPVPPHSHGRQGESKETISTSSSFEFRSAFSPTHTRVSPNQGVIEFGTPTGGPVSGGPPSQATKKRLAAMASVPMATTSLGTSEDRTVYRANLEETHLSDVAVFGGHFDPSQLTQERMESNVGDISTVGLNQPSPLATKKERGKEDRAKEKERAREKERGRERGREFASGSLKIERGGFRSKSESVSPKRKEGLEREGEREKLASWEMELSAHASKHSSVLSTPSRYRMGRVSRVLEEPIAEDNNVFADDLTKGSMPDIYHHSNPVSPAHRRTRGVKEGTPDSGISDEEKPKKKRSIGYSLGRKLSSSMRELFSKEKKINPTSGTTWHFEVGGSDLYPAPSEPQLSVLTENERREILEGTEVVPRTTSAEVVLSGQQFREQQQRSSPAVTGSIGRGNPLAHLFIPPPGVSVKKGVTVATNPKQTTPTGFYEERSVDIEEPRSPRKSVTSDNESADSEEGYVKSAVNIITTSPPPGASSPRETTLSKTGLTSSLTGVTGSQTGLPTIKERSPPIRTDSVISYEMPHSESAPIVKTLEGIVDAKSPQKGAVSKTTSVTVTTKKVDTKEKKPLFRFTKSRTVVQRRTPSPRPRSPVSVPGSASGSPQSSGRFGTKSSTSATASKLKNPESAKPGSTKIGVGGTKTGSPSGSFRGSQISVVPPGGRMSPSSRGSPIGSFRGGARSPLQSSIRSTTSATVSPISPGGQNSGRGRGSPAPGGSARSPRGSIQGGSPRGSGRGSKISPPSGSPGVKSPSPRTSTQLNVTRKLSPVVTRHPPSASANAALKGKRRLSEPVVSPLLGTSPFSRSPSERRSNVSMGNAPKPVRKAPPPPIKVGQKTSTTNQSLSRTSSQTSAAGGGYSSSSSTSSPRQRKKGVSLSHSPLSPKKLSTTQLEKDAAVATGNGDAVATTTTKEEAADDTEKLMSSIREKLAALSENSQPEDPNPLDQQYLFEVPPPPVKATPTATPLSPTGSEAKVPTYKLTPLGELKVEGEEVKEKEMETEEMEEEFTAMATPDTSRRGLRPKTVISALIGGRSKKKTVADTAATPSSGGSFRKGKGNVNLSVGSKTSTSSPLVGRKQTVASSGKQTAALSGKQTASSSGKQQRGGLFAGLPPRGPSLRGSKSGGTTGGGGRSQSTIVVPTIQINETRKSTRKVSSHATVGMATTSGGLRSSRGNALGSQGSLARSSIRVSSKLKRNNPMSPEHRRISSLNRPKLGGGERPPSRGSMRSLPRSSTVARSSVRRPARVAPVAPGKAPSSSKTSTTSGVATGNETRKTSTLNSLDSRRTSMLSKSLRKASVAKSQGEDGLNRNVAMRSMRLPSSRRVSALGTMPRSSVVSKLGGASAAGGNLQTTTAARRSMRKVSSHTRDVFDAFDEISADAKGNLLTSSDHRRAIRPKLRQKASSAHLRLLRDRDDITSDMMNTSDENGLDPNSFSTYMAKKNLAPSAVAGLTMKLDLTTVKLRKTGISDKMLMEKSADLPNFAVGAEYDTKHTTMLLQIKGRRQVHTRLVEPSVAAMNSGDVYILVSGKSLYHWIGKSANVIEKARGSDVVMRLVHKKELGCQAMAPVVIKEEVRENSKLAKIEKFWQLLGGKRGVKSSESVPNDDLYEKSVNMVITVMHLEGDSEEKAHYTTIHDSSNHLLKMSILDRNKILLFDFYSEVYVWVGKASPPKMRKKAIELAKKHFDAGCKPPVFTHHGAGGSTLIRSSGRYRAKSTSGHNPRNSTVSRSGRRVSRVRKESAVSTARPSWAMFNRLNEGSEHILFREKFSDWPEQGRIIKMKGHSITPVMPVGPVELQPADVEKMLRPLPKFEGLRLDGDNIHRGQGNYKVSRSTFACNRVHPNNIVKWVIKDNDNIVVEESDHGLFYANEAYVVRWSYRITVVKELEGLSPGAGMFARERKMREKREEKDREVKDAAQTNQVARGNDSSDTESEGEGEGEGESKKMLESGGRDKVAYFFWQGEECTVNEKGASALLTVELDKERGPQVRVVQNKEPPAFLTLFAGGMVILDGRSETMSLKSPARPVRLFCVRGHMRFEACLVEIDPEHWPMTKFFRSRGCYVVYDAPGNRVYLWKGCKATPTLRKVSHTAARLLRRRLKAELVMVEEGQEPKDMCALIGDKSAYDSLLNDTRLMDFTPRLFELSSTTGEFVASELLYPARDDCTEAAPYLQSDLYSANQPAIFLVDSQRTVYVWLGWWPQECRDWSIMRETNITTGSAHARWLRDKKLALETAQLYAKASTESRRHQPRTYMIHAGTEPDQFIHLFPFWKPNSKVQELQCKGRKPIPTSNDVEQELLKYSRTQFTLEELQKRPLPEGVDPSRLETYISDEEFQTVFKITREQFKKFPAWKQTDIKKMKELF